MVGRALRSISSADVDIGFMGTKETKTETSEIDLENPAIAESTTTTITKVSTDSNSLDKVFDKFASNSAVGAFGLATRYIAKENFEQALNMLGVPFDEWTN